MTQSNLDTRKWLQKRNLFDKDIHDELLNEKVNFPEQDFQSFTQEQWDKFYRLTITARQKYNANDTQGMVRLREKLTKIEKEWRRVSGVKKTTQTKKTKNKTGTKNKSKSREQTDELMSKATALLKYLKKEQIYAAELFEELVLAGVTSPDELNKIDSNNKFDDIRRKAIVKRKELTKDLKSNNAMKTILTKFEKLWRQQTGVQKKMETQNTNKKKKSNKKEPEGRELRQWMKKNQIFVEELFDELIKRNIVCEDDLTKLDTQEKFDGIVKTARVERRRKENTTNAKNRLDKQLVKFENLWRQKTGIKKQIGTGKKN